MMLAVLRPRSGLPRESQDRVTNRVRGPRHHRGDGRTDGSTAAGTDAHVAAGQLAQVDVLVVDVGT